MHFKYNFPMIRTYYERNYQTQLETDLYKKGIQVKIVVIITPEYFPPDTN